MDRLTPHQDFLWRLARSKSSKTRQQLVVDATTEEILAIVEICLNVLKFRFPLNTRQVRRLANYAEVIRHLARVKSERSARRILIKGEGAMLSALLIPVLTALAQRWSTQQE